jgi:hypothetical protein
MLLNDPCIFMVYALELDTKLDSIFCMLVHCHVFLTLAIGLLLNRCFMYLCRFQQRALAEL